MAARSEAKPVWTPASILIALKHKASPCFIMHWISSGHRIAPKKAPHPAVLKITLVTTLRSAFVQFCAKIATTHNQYSGQKKFP
ncbi:MAG: hypothetical protein MUF13_14150, partial [Akkermansiaceae bacterium]|nr:hypothetical protein [Akkermansiaceae bacterium]